MFKGLCQLGHIRSRMQFRLICIRLAWEFYSYRRVYFEAIDPMDDEYKKMESLLVKCLNCQGHYSIDGVAISALEQITETV